MSAFKIDYSFAMKTRRRVSKDEMHLEIYEQYALPPQVWPDFLEYYEQTLSYAATDLKRRAHNLKVDVLKEISKHAMHLIILAGFVILFLMLCFPVKADPMNIAGQVEVTRDTPKQEAAQQGMNAGTIDILEAFVTGKKIKGCENANFYFISQDGTARCGNTRK